MKELGIEPFDPVPFYYHEMRAASFAVDQQKWMRGYNNSEEAMDWMIDIARENGLEVIMERDNTFDLGPNYAHAFSTLGDGTMVSTGQQGAVEALEAKAKEYGVEIIYDTKAEYLEREGDQSGRVTGVVASKMDGSGYVRFKANQAVVLATGDFSNNKEMLAAYCPMVLPLVGYEQNEIDYNTSFNLTGIYGGDGQKMGLWAGAAWQHAYPAAPMMQGAWGGSHEPCGFHMGLNVNMNTERYQREDISAPYSSNHLLSQPGHVAFGIWTANYPQAILEKGHEWYTFGMDYTLPPLTTEELVAMWDAGVENGSYYKADTLDDLAKQTGLDAEKLKAVVARYNELCDKGEDEDFHKNPDFLVKIDENGPFYAAQNYAMFMTVMGGLRTSPEHGGVRRERPAHPRPVQRRCHGRRHVCEHVQLRHPGQQLRHQLPDVRLPAGTRPGRWQVRVGEETGESAWRRKAAGRLSETTPESGTARAACRRRATNPLPWPSPSHRRGTAFACCVLCAACAGEGLPNESAANVTAGQHMATDGAVRPDKSPNRVGGFGKRGTMPSVWVGVCGSARPRQA